MTISRAPFRARRRDRAAERGLQAANSANNESSREDAPRGMRFLYDPNRFNVATSRAHSAVIVVGNPRVFAPECRAPEQMRWANGLCRFRELAGEVVL